ncbi:hypothetical protein [Elioraea sp.]|uniref:hypothetical protein n=1 Tax=Elioraea sp. TaxID=2185103 RepID=UPI0025C2BCFA|nr:hypothetical protein [Elioraea sp.]
MASSNYVLFSQTSRPSGTRDLWGPTGLPGGTAGSVPGLIDGAAGAFPRSAFNAFGGTEFVRPDWALFDFAPFGETDAEAVLTGAIWAGGPEVGVVSDGRVFSGPESARNPTFTTIDLTVSGTVFLGLADEDWNGVKNVEVALTSAGLNADTTVVSVRNIVDVRISIGDDPPPAQPPIPPIFTAEVYISNVKRGELDASASPYPVRANISLTSNGPDWGNTFVVDGSAFDDSVWIRRGDWNAEKTTLDGFRNLVNDGRYSLIVADLGEGNDRFDAGLLFDFDGPIAGSAPLARTDIRLGPDRGSADFMLSDGFELSDRFLRTASTSGDRLICSDGPDLIRYARGDGTDRIDRFDPARDRIVLEGFDPAEIAVFDVWRAGDRLGPAALILFDVGDLQAGLNAYATSQAILVTDMSAPAVSSALIFA